MKQLILLAGIFLSVGCQQQQDSTQQVSVPQKNITVEKPMNDQMISAKATVKYFTFEGGFYGLITADGKKLLPLNLAPKYRQDGAVINVSGKLVKDVMTTAQWGQPFEVTKIELISAGTSQSVTNSQI